MAEKAALSFFMGENEKEAFSIPGWICSKRTLASFLASAAASVLATNCSPLRLPSRFLALVADLSLGESLSQAFSGR